MDWKFLIPRENKANSDGWLLTLLQRIAIYQWWWTDEILLSRVSASRLEASHMLTTSVRILDEEMSFVDSHLDYSIYSFARLWHQWIQGQCSQYWKSFIVYYPIVISIYDTASTTRSNKARWYYWNTYRMAILSCITGCLFGPFEELSNPALPRTFAKIYASFARL